jgi:hypothetical protein
MFKHTKFLMCFILLTPLFNLKAGKYGSLPFFKELKATSTEDSFTYIGSRPSYKASDEELLHVDAHKPKPEAYTYIPLYDHVFAQDRGLFITANPRNPQNGEEALLYILDLMSYYRIQKLEIIEEIIITSLNIQDKERSDLVRRLSLYFPHLKTIRINNNLIPLVSPSSQPSQVLTIKGDALLELPKHIKKNAAGVSLPNFDIKEINIVDTKTTKLVLFSIVSFFPHVTKLSLEGSDLTDEDFNFLSRNLKALRELEILGNHYLTSLTFFYLNRVVHLERLAIGMVHFDMDSLHHLTDLKKLQALKLQFKVAYLRDIGFLFLKKLPKLRLLWLSAQESFPLTFTIDSSLRPSTPEMEEELSPLFSLDLLKYTLLDLFVFEKVGTESAVVLDVKRENLTKEPKTSLHF